MKVFYVTMAMFAAVVTITVVHINLVNSFSISGTEILARLDSAVEREDFAAANEEIYNFENLYQSRRGWFSVILDTHDLDKIELHIAKMRQFLELSAITEFYGEFVELRSTVNSLPHNEGVGFGTLF